MSAFSTTAGVTAAAPGRAAIRSRSASIRGCAPAVSPPAATTTCTDSSGSAGKSARRVSATERLLVLVGSEDGPTVVKATFRNGSPSSTSSAPEPIATSGARRMTPRASANQPPSVFSGASSERRNRAGARKSMCRPSSRSIAGSTSSATSSAEAETSRPPTAIE